MISVLSQWPLCSEDVADGEVKGAERFAGAAVDLEAVFETDRSDGSEVAQAEAGAAADVVEADLGKIAGGGAALVAQKSSA